MNSKKVIGGGLATGVVFYALSLIVWVLFKFLPVVPTSIVIMKAGLQKGWLIEHLIVSLFIGLLWCFGYALCSKACAREWCYGLAIYIAGLLPAFAIQFVVFPELRVLTIYGAIVSLIAVLLTGKVISLVVKR